MIAFKIRFKPSGTSQGDWRHVDNVEIADNVPPASQHSQALRAFIQRKGGVVDPGVYEAVPAASVKQFVLGENPRSMSINPVPTTD